jgi:hypothetical protein
VGAFTSDFVMDWQYCYNESPKNDFLDVDAVERGFLLAGLRGSYSPPAGSSVIVRVDQDGIVVDSCPLFSATSYTSQSTSKSNWTVAPTLIMIADAGQTTTSTPSSLSLIETELYADECQADFQEYGLGVAGSGGWVPQLSGQAGWCRGRVPRVQISQGLGSAGGLLFAGTIASSLPFFSGTLYVDPLGASLFPIRLHGAAGVPGNGSLDIPILEGLHAMIGQSIYLQVFFHDSQAPAQVSMTNGLQTDVH